MFVDNLARYVIDDGELELIVSGANIAGHMEKAGKIDCGTDMELMELLLKAIPAWVNDDRLPSFPEYIEEQLLNEFT